MSSFVKVAVVRLAYHSVFFLSRDRNAASVAMNWASLRWERTAFMLGFRALPPFLIISGGGVSTTTLGKHLRQFASVNSPADSDGLKHMQRIPRRWARSSKVLFLWGEPSRQVQSIQRRGWLRIQLSKLQGFSGVFVKESDLPERLEVAIRKQAQNMARLQPEVMLLRYPEFFTQSHEVADFLGISDARFLETWPEYTAPKFGPPEGSSELADSSQAGVASGKIVDSLVPWSETPHAPPEAGSSPQRD